jgi:hypothetical protein
MFLSLAKSMEREESACSVMTTEIEKAYQYISTAKLPLTGELISSIEKFRDEIFPKLTEENEANILDDTKS